MQHESDAPTKDNDTTHNSEDKNEDEGEIKIVDKKQPRKKSGTTKSVDEEKELTENQTPAKLEDQKENEKKETDEKPQRKKIAKPKDQKDDEKTQVDKKTGRKKTRIFFKTKAIAETLSRRESLIVTLRGCLVQIFYVFFATVYCLGLNSASIFYTNEAMKIHFVSPFVDANGLYSDFTDISSISDIWQYILDEFLPSLFETRISQQYSAEAERRCSLYVNKLLGSARIRQVKVKNGSCHIWSPIKKYRQTCYGYYSEKDKATESFGLGDTTAWRFNTKKETGELDKNSISTYTGDGFYIDLTNDENVAFSIIKDLKQNLWIGPDTRAVFLKAAFYNPNLNLFSFVEILFELLPTGAIKPSSEMHTVQLVRYVTTYEKFVLVCQYIYYVFVIVFMLQVIRNVIYFRHRVFLQLWVYVDTMIFAFSLATFLVFLHADAEIKKTLERLKRSEQSRSYGNIEAAVYHSIFSSHLSALSTFFVYFRTFQYLKISKTMEQLQNTIKKCAFDIGMFSIIFLIVFLAFCHFGYLLFGNRVAGFSTFNMSMFTLFRTVFGDFDYEEIVRGDPVAGPLFFLVYIIFMFFILLNLFLSIISDTYTDVKSDLVPKQMQIYDLIKMKIKRLFRMCGLKLPDEQEKDEESEEIEKIRTALRKCGFSLLEINMFLARYNIDPLAEVGEYEIGDIREEIERREALQRAKVKKGLKQEEDLHINLEDFEAENERLLTLENTLDKLHNKTDMLLAELNRKIIVAKRLGLLF